MLDKLERFLRQLIVLGIATIIFAQLLMTTEYGRHLLSQTDRMEGTTVQPLNFKESVNALPSRIKLEDNQPKASISLRLLTNIHQGNVKVLLNGREAAHFTDEVLTLQVQNNDILQIDTAECSNIVTLQIIGVSHNLAFPKLNTSLVCKGNVATLGRVKLK